MEDVKPRVIRSPYGTFALVIGLLSWIYFAARITLLAAEANVVASRRLWPRSFSLVLEQPAIDADRNALRRRGISSAKARQRHSWPLREPSPSRCYAHKR